MIYFATDSTRHRVTSVPDKLEIVTGAEVFSLIRHSNISSIVALDYETTGRDALVSNILLCAIGTKTDQFVIDATGDINIANLLGSLNINSTWIAHNIKFEYQMTKVHYNIKLNNLYDTMIAEQRLYANMFEPRDRPFQLDNVVRRNLGYVPPAMNKDIRSEFIGANPKTFVFENRHIEYNASDVQELFPLHAIQIKRIQQYNMTHLLYDIEFRLIKIIAEAELEGYDLDTEKLKEIVEENKIIKVDKEKLLDEMVRELRDKYATEENKIYLTSGKYDRERVEPIETKQASLLDEFDIKPIGIVTKKKVKAPANKAYINYSSTKEIIEIIGRLGFPVPTSSGEYVIPKFDNKNKLINSYDDLTTGEAAIEQYIIDNPDSPIKPFIRALIDYREVTTELSKYGLDFINKLNPITGRIHTMFRQCDAVNGRFQSGGGRENQSDKINIQNFPRKMKFRQLIYRKGYKIITHDLTGAEVTVMADKANDKKLFELAMKGKIHEIVATTGWRNIFAYRGEPNDEFIVSKESNLELYTKCKNLTFGGIYGCGEKKAAKTISVLREEGRVYLNTLKSLFPDTFVMVERNSKFAQNNGYLINNPITNSRIWFPKVMQAIRDQTELQFEDRVEVDGQARNVPISGTQADMVKEAMVNIQDFIDNEKLDAAILFQVHDEIVSRCIPEEAEYYSTKKKEIICNTANKYLKNIKMDATGVVADTWVK